MVMFSPILENEGAPGGGSDDFSPPPQAGLAARACALIQAAARHLGLSEPAASRVAETSLLRSGDNRVAFRPLGLSGIDRLSMAVSVYTVVPIAGHGERHGPMSILRSAPSMFWAFSTAFSATSDGHWAVLRKVDLGPHGGAALAAHVVETVQLAEYLFREGSLVEH